MFVSMNNTNPVSKKYSAYQSGSAAAQKTKGTAAQYDKVELSRSGADLNFQQMVSRVVGEVRTANTTADIQKIKEEVQSGTYKIDPAEIAARMMLEGTNFG